MPALYIGHGAPPLLDDPVWSGAARGLGRRPAAPRAILIVSAHWESAPVSLTASGRRPGLRLRRLRREVLRMTYGTPDATALAQRVAAMMPDTEPVHQHASRGLDHGAWVPLRIMYPEADIPVLQLSLPDPGPRAPARARPAAAPAARRGRADHRLRLPHPRPAVPEGVPDRGRGTGLVQRLRRLGRRGAGPRRRRRAGGVPPKAPGMPYAHPTVEHYTPLFVTLGAATDAERAGHPGDRRVLDGAVEAVAAGRLRRSTGRPGVRTRAFIRAATSAATCLPSDPQPGSYP